MRISFWGVRGSYPVPGPNTIRYGGHTSCIEVRSATGDCLIVDAGTGLRGLGHKLAEAQGERRAHYHIVLSHVHWDHIQGLPYFEPAYLEGTKISIYAQRAAADELQHVIGGITRHEFFPVDLDAVPAEFEFHEVSPGQPLAIGSFAVAPIALNHPFGATGYRVNSDNASFAYVSDTAPFTDMLHKQHFLSGPETPSDEDLSVLRQMETELKETVRGTHTVVYDTHFLPEEYARFPHYGHSTPDQAIAICRDIDVRRLVLFHHAPGHNDEIMDKIEATYQERGRAVGLDVVAAREGMTLTASGGDL